MLKKVFSRGTALALTLAALVSPLTAAAAWQYTDYAYVRVFYTDGTGNRWQAARRGTAMAPPSHTVRKHVTSSTITACVHNDLLTMAAGNRPPPSRST